MPRIFLTLLFLISSVGMYAQNTQGLANVSGQTTLSWEECLAEAVKFHPDLIAASQGVEGSKAGVAIAKGKQGPAVTANASVGRAHAQGQDSNSSSIGVNSNWTLFDGGALQASTRGARANLSASQAGYLVASAQLRYNLRAAYIGLWKAQSMIEIARSILKIREGSYRLIELRYQAGIEHLGSLKSAAAKLAKAQASLASAKRDIVSAQANLSKAIGAPMTRAWAVGDLTLPVPANEIPDFDTLSKTHPSYLQTKALEKVAYEALKAVQADNWPTVALQANASRQSNDIPPKENQTSVSAQVSYTVFDGSVRAASAQKARAAYRAAQASVQASYNNMYATLQQAWSSLSDALESAKVQTTFLEADAEREKIAVAQYNVGLINYDNWTIIEDNFVNTKQADLSARANGLLALAAWEQAKGVSL